MTYSPDTMLLLAAHPLLHALGWTLLHFCWQGTAVALLLWSALSLLPARSSQARYTIACIAMILMVAFPLATFAHVAAAEARAHTQFADSSTALTTDFTLQVGAYAPVLPLSARIGMALESLLPWLLLAWFAGILIFASRLNFGLLIARRLKTAATETPSPDLLHSFELLRNRLGITRAIRLLHSARVQVPTVIGWLRPVVLLPMSCLSGLSPDQIEAVLCHELAHVRRHDYLVSVLQSVVETILFYHPAVWWVSKQVRRERECCCDEIAIANGGNALAYARALSVLEENRAAFPEFVLGANGGVLTMRIQRLLGSKRNAQPSQLAALLLLGIAITGATSYAVTVARAQVHESRSTTRAHSEPLIATSTRQLLALNSAPAALQLAGSSAASAPSNPATYQAWLQEDVAYIITPDERAAFLKLSTDEDRNQFIQQFWARRDPPGTPAGTYRADYYQRIAYANQHFDSPAKPGWSTDRGRTYIMNGRPHDIQSHPSGGATSIPYEIWHYTSDQPGQPDVYLKFVDDAGNGQYRLMGQVPAPNTGGGAQNAQAAALLVALAERSPQPAAAFPADGKPATISAGVIQGNLIYKVDPVYPPIAKAAHVQGIVVLHAHISKTGTIEDLQVISGAPMLTPSAIDAVRQWKYKPYTVNGDPTEVETTININFALAPPDLSCTYYDPHNIAHPGTCEENPTDRGTYSCRADDNRELIQSQSSCEFKVKRLQAPNDNADASSIQIAPPQSPQNRPPVSATNHPAEYDGTPLRKIGNGVTSPMLIYKVDPQYSPEARSAKFSGVVLVNLIVDAQGNPQNVHIVRGVGMGLDEKALEAIKHYKFRPAYEAGKPVPTELNVEVNFQVPNSPQPQSSAAAPTFSPVVERTPTPNFSPALVTAAPLAYKGVPVRTVAGDVTPPKVINKVDPDFSTEARKKKFQGVVTVALIVDTKGRPQNVHVTHGVGMGLDENAVAAVKKYKFTPATENGKPVPVAINVEVDFRIF